MVRALVWVRVKFLGKTLNSLAVPLSTQVYKWVPANLMLGVTLRWTSIPSRDCWSPHATEPDKSSGLMSHLVCTQTFPYSNILNTEWFCPYALASASILIYWTYR